MACLFSLPVLVLYHVFILRRTKCINRKLQGKSEIETHELAQISSKEKITNYKVNTSEEVTSHKEFMYGVALSTELQILERSESKLAVTKTISETCEEVLVESLLKHYSY